MTTNHTPRVGGTYVGAGHAIAVLNRRLDALDARNAGLVARVDAAPEDIDAALRALLRSATPAEKAAVVAMLAGGAIGEGDPGDTARSKLAPDGPGGIDPMMMPRTDAPDPFAQAVYLGQQAAGVQTSHADELDAAMARDRLRGARLDSGGEDPFARAIDSTVD